MFERYILWSRKRESNPRNTALTYTKMPHSNVQSLREKATKLMSQWIKDYDGTTSDLYHYCDSEALLGIMSSKELWATDIRHLNDPREFEYGCQLIHELFTKKSSDYKDASIEAIRRYTPAQINRFENDSCVYVACFSGHKDMLSQWRSYASGGSGYALQLTAPRYLDPVEPVRAGPAIRKVEYCPRMQHKYVEAWVEIMCESNYQQIHSNEQSVHHAHFYIENLFWHFIAEATVCFKSEFFVEEKETRLVWFNPAPSSLHYRSSARGITPYVKFPLCSPHAPVDNCIQVTGVRYGPSHNARKAESVLNALKVTHNLPELLISRSSGALR